MAVVEEDPEHAAPQRLDDLAFELDLLFLVGDSRLLSEMSVRPAERGAHETCLLPRPRSA